ncbi:DUF1214 domain-containing protein [Novosphingobium sp. G106]|uniref:DUF1214 domain-containing protein n=1 Tax=Novosphingobium sp. G106 TaxID=2849500 RepID=UPI001C2D090C|nr:DUF1214 domain-containing protein [Novosphingobium sp. G106]MBV1688350.1 DUF1214 domain-containing protein [Novosphingobium sp. G106]
MITRRRWPLGLAAIALAALSWTARAAAAPTDPATQQGAVAGWQDFVESLRTLPDRMLAKLPEPMRNDPQMQQEVARLALEALASQTLDAIAGDGDAPQFMPSIGQVLNIGQPNADTIYRSAHITPGGAYRLRGIRGNVSLAIIQQVLPPTDPNRGAAAQLDLATVKVDKDGRFDVLVSPTKPAGYAGDWWELSPSATRLMIRMVSADWAKEVDPTLSIERLDKPIGRPRPSATLLEGRLRALPGQIDFIAQLFVDHVDKLRKQGVVNQVKVFNPPFSILKGQFYYEGTYDLKDDEALIIESNIPTKCNYRSLILTNEIYETTDWYNNHASLNGAQAAPDPDGKLRIVVSAKDPGAKNWLDTSGYPTGMIQGRWTGCDSEPIPNVQKVKVAEVLKVLPKGVATVTPAQRQDILRERRRALQERPLW